jgi:hypothetical protein
MRDMGKSELECDWTELMAQMRANIVLAEGAYNAGDYGQCRAYLRDIEALCWAARGKAQSIIT